MTEYYQTIRERKDLANQARHKKNGSKSKKCSLSTDHMTQKQIEERNGPVMTYSLGKPMVWEEFKKLPAEIQREYLQDITEKYAAPASKVSQMFGVSLTTVNRLTGKPEFGFKFKTGKRQTPEQKIAWEFFLKGEDNQLQVTEKHEPMIVPMEAVVPVQVEAKPKMAMNHFTLSFNGPIDVEMIANSLRAILGRTSVGSIEIGCNLA